MMGPLSHLGRASLARALPSLRGSTSGAQPPRPSRRLFPAGPNGVYAASIIDNAATRSFYIRMTQTPQTCTGYRAEEYFGLVDAGLISPDERCELLAGWVVAMAPQSPRHANAVWRATNVLTRAVGSDAVVRAQLPLLLGETNVPEPDVAVVVGPAALYEEAHPSSALLCVEIADSSLIQDRFTKSRIYAAAGVPEFWIVNLRERVVEILCDHDCERSRYRERRVVHPGDSIDLRLGADINSRLAVADLLAPE